MFQKGQKCTFYWWLEWPIRPRIQEITQISPRELRYVYFVTTKESFGK